MRLADVASRLKPRDDGPLSPSTTALLITLIVVGSLALLAIAAFLFLRSRSEQRWRHASRADPYLTRKEFKRRSKMTAAERTEEDELQRSIMIRKSLASRTSTRTVHDDVDSEFEVAMAHAPGARVYHPDERRSREQSRGRPVTPYYTSRPASSRSPSPDRSPLLEGPGSPPPHPDVFGRTYHGLPSMTSRPPQIEASALVFGESLREDGRIHRFIWRAS